jgi:hypothetical protein
MPRLKRDADGNELRPDHKGLREGFLKQREKQAWRKYVKTIERLDKKGLLEPGADATKIAQELTPELTKALVFGMSPFLGKSSDNVMAAKLILAYRDGQPKSEHKIDVKKTFHLTGESASQLITRLDALDARFREASGGVDGGGAGGTKALAAEGGADAIDGEWREGDREMGEGIEDTDGEGSGGDRPLPVSEGVLGTGDEVSVSDSLQGEAGGDNAGDERGDAGEGDTEPIEPDLVDKCEAGHGEPGSELCIQVIR